MLGLIVIVAIGAIVSYNRFVSQRQLIKDAWANIDTELRRRYDLIPNLVETVKGYASHEREVFEEVTRGRASWPPVPPGRPPRRPQPKVRSWPRSASCSRSPRPTRT